MALVAAGIIIGCIKVGQKLVSCHVLLDSTKKGIVLGRANEADGLTVVTVVGVVSVEVAIVEVHVPRVVAIVVRSRPVVAVAAHIVDRSPVAVASGRQEDLCTRRRLSFTPCQKNGFQIE